MTRTAERADMHLGQMKFTDAEQAAILDARNSGMTWVQTALSIHRCVADVRAYGRDVMAMSAYVAGKEPKPKPFIDRREPWPAGHPVTWGAITARTILAGALFRGELNWGTGNGS